MKVKLMQLLMIPLNILSLQYSIIILLVASSTVNSQLPSPCPKILRYEPRNIEDDKWYALLTLQSDEELTGIFINIVLDRPAFLLGNWIGDVSSSDNKEFLIQDRQLKIKARTPLSLKFFARFNIAETIPSVEIIRFNGKTVCRRVKTEFQDEISSVETAGIITLPSSTKRPYSVTENREDDVYKAENFGLVNRPTSTSRPFLSNDRRDANHRVDVHTSTLTTRPKTTRKPFVGDDTQEDFNRVEYLDSTSHPSKTSVTYIDDNRNRRTSTSKLNVDPFSVLELEMTSTSRTSNFGAGYPLSSSQSEQKPISSVVKPQEDKRKTDIVSGGNSTSSIVDDDSDYFHGDFQQIVDSQYNRLPAASSFQSNYVNRACGIVTETPSPLVARGQDTTQGQWPWHVSLYHSRGLQLQYICGGTLITSQHVLTAAHCLTKPTTESVVNKKNLLVYLGKHTLINFGPEVQDRNLADIYVHPDYNATSYFNDIAVIKLFSPVNITNYVRTCCLWEDDPNLESVENRVGTVVGWGFDENKKLSNKLMQAQMPVVSTIKCIYSNRDFFSKYTFEKNFCAGFRNGTTVCNGDSGGGLVFPKRSSNSQNTVWQLRGLVSIGVGLQGHGICDTSQFIVFTDVAKFTHWIRQVIAF